MITTLAHDTSFMDTMASTMPLIAGLLAGGLHVFVGPDHLAAVAPLAVEQRKRLWLSGTLWGLGHSSGMWLLAILALAFREALPVEALSHWAELTVGVVLIALGLWGLRRVLRSRIHSHPHTHTDSTGQPFTHDHMHAHGAPQTETQQQTPHAHTHGLLGIGTLHGVAGSAHLLGILPALAMPSRLAAVTYVIAFGVGSILAMGIFTTGLGTISQTLNRASPSLSRFPLAACSLISVAVGVYWLA